ncbi:MAG: hypothetical protein ABIS36_05205 [Chryseolinea sp.]
MKHNIVVFIFLSIATAHLLVAQTPLPDNIVHDITMLNFKTSVDSLKQIIDDMQQVKELDNPHLAYWKSYAQYLLYFQVNADEHVAVQTIDMGLSILEDCKKKNSEHYALQALLKGLDISYSRGMTIPFKAAANEKYARKAVELNPNNPRGYYALAVKDYYTPSAYGGGKIVEENLLKAISLPDRADPGPYAPTWGKGDAYWYLVMYYDKRKNPDLAKKYLEEGLLVSPDNYGLNRMKKKLEQ